MGVGEVRCCIEKKKAKHVEATEASFRGGGSSHCDVEVGGAKQGKPQEWLLSAWAGLFLIGIVKP